MNQKLFLIILTMLLNLFAGFMKYPKGNGLYRVEQLCRATWDSRIH